MSNNIDANKYSALLASTQQLRTHWGSLIINVMNFTIFTNVAVLTFFLQAYIRIFNDKSVWDHSYIAFASTISLVLLFLWRLYTRYLDNGIAKLYPDFIYFEGKLSCPSQYGTSGYLKREFGDAGGFLQSDLSTENKSEVVSHLVNINLSGGRGHDKINWITLGIMVVLVLIVFGLGIWGFLSIGFGADEQGIIRPVFKWICGIFSVGALISMITLMKTWSKKPSREQVDKIVSDVTKTES